MSNIRAKTGNHRDDADKSLNEPVKNDNLGIEYQQQQKKSSTKAQLCQNQFFEECPSSAITDAVYTAGVKGMDFWTPDETGLTGGKNFSAGRVELLIRDRFDLNDFAEITYQAKEVIAGQFGERTLKLHYALAAIAFRHPEGCNRKIKISASKLLADFGEKDKNRRYIPENERNEEGKSSRYFSKEEKLRTIAHHSYLLKRLEVWVREWRVRSKGIFSVERSHLWDIFAITEVIQKDIYGNDTLIDIEITFQPGLWFEKFAGKEYLREFGYITSEALKLDPHREKMALRLAYFALFALQQHKNGRYQLETLLKRIGYEKEIEDGKTDRVAASNLKRGFDRALKILGSFQHPYRFEYDPEAPEWVERESKKKKPRGWFEIWLKLQGTLHQPDALPKRKPETATAQNTFIEIEHVQNIPSGSDKNQKSKESNTEPFPQLPLGRRIKEARLKTGKSLRTMAKELKIASGRLSEIENDRYPHTLNPEFKARLLVYLGLED